MIRFGALSVVGLIAGGCADDRAPSAAACIAPLEQSCSIIWNDYDAIYDNLIMPRCGSGTGQGFCHAAGGPTGLDLSERELAYQAMLGDAQGDPTVIPGNVECSELIKRLASTDPAYSMPRGASLKSEELCSIVQWVANGAER